MKIYTKTGDCGQTSLASGERVSKTDARLEAYGTADELNSFVGLLLSSLSDDAHAQEQLVWVQNKLFNLGAALALAPGEWITNAEVQQLENWMDQIQEQVPPTRGFVLPGGNQTISLCHVCRTITRRLERQIVGLEQSHLEVTPGEEICKFVNRLSDFWFLFAQKCGKNAGIPYMLWKK